MKFDDYPAFVLLIVQCYSVAASFCNFKAERIGENKVEIVTAGYPEFSTQNDDSCSCKLSTSGLSNVTSAKVIVEANVEEQVADNECSPFIHHKMPYTYRFICAEYAPGERYEADLSFAQGDHEFIVANNNARRIRATLQVRGISKESDAALRVECKPRDLSLQVAGCPCASSRDPVSSSPGVSIDNNDTQLRILIGCSVAIGVLTVALITSILYVCCQRSNSNFGRNLHFIERPEFNGNTQKGPAIVWPKLNMKAENGTPYKLFA